MDADEERNSKNETDEKISTSFYKNIGGTKNAKERTDN